MKIEYFGHSCVRLTVEDGTRILIDPYDGIGYPMPRLRAEIVLCTHGHFDHHYLEGVEGAREVIEKVGSYDRGPFRDGSDTPRKRYFHGFFIGREPFHFDPVYLFVRFRFELVRSSDRQSYSRFVDRKFYIVGRIFYGIFRLLAACRKSKHYCHGYERAQ